MSASDLAAGQPGSREAAGGARLLMVDDEEAIVRIFRRKFEKMGYEVHTARSGEEALTALAKSAIDLLITDITMPKMSGIELMHRAVALQPDLQCIVMTGYEQIETAVAAMRLGAINYFSKPVDFESLEVAIRKGLEKKQLQEELARERQSIEKANRELRLYRDRLEKLVAERTAELQEANDHLRQEMCERQQAEQEAESRRQQLIEADKLMSLGVLVAGVAHEINNPNTFIMMNAPILRRAWEDLQPLLDQHRERCGDFAVSGLPYSEMRAHIPELFSGMVEGAERIKQIVLSLKDYARKDVADLNQRVQINEVLKAALTLLANPLRKATHRLEVDYGEGLPPVTGNFQRIEQVLINVIQNACQALTWAGGGIAIATICDRRQKTVVVRVQDGGCGIPPAHLKQIKDPFFTTKRDSGGTGLGLSISAGIMEEHGGSLLFDSRVGEGTTVRIVFPAAEEA